MHQFAHGSDEEKQRALEAVGFFMNAADNVDDAALRKRLPAAMPYRPAPKTTVTLLSSHISRYAAELGITVLVLKLLLGALIDVLWRAIVSLGLSF